MDYPEWYKAVSAPFRNACATRALGVVDRGLVLGLAIAHLASLVWLAATWDVRFVKALLVPAGTFALVSAIRAGLDKPRPYNVFDINPLLVKGRQGKSFPSRHVSSAVIIACTLMWLSPVAGVPALIASIFVSATRIIGGVHFPADVVAAIVIAVACAVMGYIAFP